MTQRARTLKPKRLSDDERELIAVENSDEIRPKTRAACSFHLYLDVNPRNGHIKYNFPDRELWDLDETCALDVADRGGITLEDVGLAMNLTRERVRQVEATAQARLRADHPNLNEPTEEDIVIANETKTATCSRPECPDPTRERTGTKGPVPTLCEGHYRPKHAKRKLEKKRTQKANGKPPAVVLPKPRVAVRPEAMDARIRDLQAIITRVDAANDALRKDVRAARTLRDAALRDAKDTISGLRKKVADSASVHERAAESLSEAAKTIRSAAGKIEALQKGVAHRDTLLETAKESIADLEQDLARASAEAGNTTEVDPEPPATVLALTRLLFELEPVDVEQLPYAFVKRCAELVAA